jgi:hypothetical protein
LTERWKRCVIRSISVCSYCRAFASILSWQHISHVPESDNVNNVETSLDTDRLEKPRASDIPETGLCERKQEKEIDPDLGVTPLK